MNIPAEPCLDGEHGDSELSDQGGDPACWLARVCPDCGRFVEELPTRCPRCGAEVTDD
jgi:rubrerythrin